MKKLLGLFALLLASSAAAQSYGGYPDYGYSGQRFNCESVNGRQNYCRVDTRGGVQLVRQLSKSPCVRGSTWNYDRGGVWVSQGCRAQFTSGYDNDNGYGYGSGYGNGYGQTIRCESIDNRTRECAADTRGGVRLTRRLSKSPCEEGRNWGYHRDRVWVSGGCRAEFQLGRGGDQGWGGGYGNDYGYGYGQTVRCESVDNRTRECPADVRRGVQLVRQISKTRCEQGRNWGYHHDRVWVSGGWRAEIRGDWCRGPASRWGRRLNCRHERRHRLRTLRPHPPDPLDRRGAGIAGPAPAAVQGRIPDLRDRR